MIYGIILYKKMSDQEQTDFPDDQVDFPEEEKPYSNSKKYYEIDDITCPFPHEPGCEGLTSRRLTTNGKWIRLSKTTGEYLGFIGFDPNGRKAHFIPQERRWKNSHIVKNTIEEYGEENTTEFSEDEEKFKKTLSPIPALVNHLIDTHERNQAMADFYSQPKESLQQSKKAKNK